MTEDNTTTTPTPTWLRVLTWSATALTIICAISLIIVLIGYFSGFDVWPGFYGAGLFGLPAGFALMLLALILNGVQRRRALS